MTTNTNAALRSAAESALEALEILNGIDTETESVTIHVSDEIAALRAALTTAAAVPAAGMVTVPEEPDERMERAIAGAFCGTVYEAREAWAAGIAAAPKAAPQPAVQQGESNTEAIIRDLLDVVEQHTCEHHETYRGGSIWEICSDCGARWADDEGGKPAFQWPKAVERAREFLLAAPTTRAAPVAQGDALPVAAKTHGAWDGLETLADLPDGTELYAHSPVAQGDAEDAARYRWLRRKFCLTGNGDGTCHMHAINLPASIKGWPEPIEAEIMIFCDAAIDAARSQAKEGA